MSAGIEVDLHREIVAGERLVLVFDAKDADVDAEFVLLEDIVEIRLGLVGDDLVDVLDALEDDHALLDRHDRLVLGVRSIECRIGVKTDDEVIALGFCLLKHEEMTCMAEVECARGEAFFHRIGESCNEDKD